MKSHTHTHKGGEEEMEYMRGKWKATTLKCFLVSLPPIVWANLVMRLLVHKVRIWVEVVAGLKTTCQIPSIILSLEC